MHPEPNTEATALSGLGNDPTQVVRAAAVSGALTILDLFDSLPFFRPAYLWTPWRAFLAAAYGLPMTPEELAIFRECTGRQRPPTEPSREVVAICGRRAGKSRIVGSVVAPYHAVLRDYSGILAPGERATIPVLAKDKDDAQAILGYCKATFALEAFRGFVLRERAEGLDLTIGVDITVRAARITAARSRTVPMAALDEIAFWPNEESAQPDQEIVAGIRPAMSTVPGAMIFRCSSPYAERGVLWEDYDKHFGKEGSVLVWKAPTLRMHPHSVQVKAEVERAYAEDAVSAAAEYGAEFRKDVQVFVTREAVRAATTKGITDRAPIYGYRYFAFVDPSGGSSDSFTLAISHFDHSRQKAVLDTLSEWQAPFKDEDGNPVGPDWVVGKIAARLKPYSVNMVTGDAYGGEWPRDSFLKHGLAYHRSDKAKARIYVDFLPLLNSRIAELLDHPKLEAQLVGLDRRTSRGGQDSIDHRPGAHDDIANAVAGACVLASEQGRYVSKEEPQKQWLTPDGKPDYLGMRQEQMREAFKNAMNPPEPEGDPRYRFMG